ncbi:MAG: hypothetical protein QNK05_25385 [Myxococcota bacterium]|nr:hypothetical protein [Myxococcota bacterium]
MNLTQWIFERTIREPFAFLESECGLSRVASPREPGRGPVVRFESEATWVDVEKDPWSRELHVTLGPTEPEPSVPVIPLGALLQLRSPNHLATDYAAPFKEQVLRNARALREVAGDLLEGDFSISSAVRQVLAENAARDPSTRAT